MHTKVVFFNHLYKFSRNYLHKAAFFKSVFPQPLIAPGFTTVQQHGKQGDTVKTLKNLLTNGHVSNNNYF